MELLTKETLDFEEEISKRFRTSLEKGRTYFTIECKSIFDYFFLESYISSNGFICGTFGKSFPLISVVCLE